MDPQEELLKRAMKIPDLKPQAEHMAKELGMSDLIAESIDTPEE